MEVGSQICKFVMISVDTCYKSVGNHPFVVGILLFFIYLHRSFPLLFSVLVSSSPVLVCTAVLLGTVLSFGQSNIPEIETQTQTQDEDLASLRTWVPGGDTHVAERFIEKLSESGSTDYRFNDEFENLHNTLENQGMIKDVDRDIELPDHVEAVDAEQRYTLLQKVRDQILQVQDDNASPQSREQFDSFVGDYGHDNRGEASDLESDGAESSSPDASMADILPILDELHPLLDSEAPQPAHDATLDSSDELDQVEQVEEDDNGGDEEDEEQVPAQGDMEDESKSAITWTDDDQKNLMDLGNLELERNQRLESLIARRRARKSFKLTAEKNLIDFDGFDLPFNVSPISTTRRNPFDNPFDDSYGNMHIPGSAPSILLARRNPFDLPYDSNEEKPDLKGDHFEQEFLALHANDTFFCRHESFSLGASSLGAGAKHERQNLQWKPLFVPESLASEGTDYSSFQRQSSEVSESKLSSVPDSDSVSSVADLDDRKISEQDFTTAIEVISNIYHASSLVDHGSHSYEDIYSLEMEQADERDVLHDGLAVELGEREILEPSLLDNGGLATLDTDVLDLNPELVKEEDSSSTSSLSSLSEADEKISDVRKGGENLEASGDLVKDFLTSSQHSVEKSDVQFMSMTADEKQFEEPSLSVNGGLAPLVTNDLHQHPELVKEEDSSSTSSLSSLSEADEKISVVKEGGENFDASGNLNKELLIWAQHLLEDSDVQFMSMTADEKPFKEPIYDSIPLDAENLISLNSISYDMQAEISEVVMSQPSEEMYVPFVHKDRDVDGENIETTTSGDEKICGATSKVHEADAIEEDQPQLTCSLSEVEGDLPKNLEVNAASSESSYHYLLSSEQTSEQEKDLSWLDKSLVEPCFGDHLEALVVEDNVKEEVDDIKEINVKLLFELDTVGDFCVKEVVAKPLHYELITEEGNAGSTDTGLSRAGSNLSEPDQELPVLEHIHEGVEGVDGASKQIHEGVNVEELLLPGVVDNEPEVSESKVQTVSQLSTVEAVSVEDIITSSNPAPVSSVNEFPQLLDTERSAKLHPNLPPEGNDVSADVLSDAVEEVESGNVCSSIQETSTTHITLKQLSEGNVADLPNSSNSKLQTDLHREGNEVSSDVLSDVLEEIESGIIGSTVQETLTTNIPLKKLSEDNIAELLNPSDSNVVSAEMEAEAVVEIVYGVEESQETITDFPLKQVLEVDVCEPPKPSSNDGCEEVSTAAGDAIEDIGSNNTGSGVEETMPIHGMLKKVSESNVAETIEIGSGIREVVQEPIPTQVSEKNAGVHELPKLFKFK